MVLVYPLQHNSVFASKLRVKFLVKLDRLCHVVSDLEGIEHECVVHADLQQVEPLVLPSVAVTRFVLLGAGLLLQ